VPDDADLLLVTSKQKGWWWETAEPKKRFRFAILMLMAEALLALWAISDPHAIFSDLQGWVWAISLPFLVPFFVLQALRARRESAS
jgi:hypothetical protein